MHHRLAVTLILALAVAAAGCSMSGASSGGVGGGQPANPGEPGVPGGGASTEPTPGGTFGDALPAGPPQPVGPIPADPTIVTAQPGQTNLRPAHPFQLSSRIDGTGHVVVRVRWWGGIEPCETLDSVVVTRDGNRFSLTVRVGAPAGLNVACIEIARDTATLVDLGVLPTGSYSVRADPGDAPPLTINVP
jgi:hypothetical protein